MSDATDAAMEGVFYSPTLQSARDSRVGGFCKPVHILIYSAPPPVRMRVVCYQIQYWPSDEQPTADQLLSGGALYHDSRTGQNTFSFTTGVAVTNLTVILGDIRRHFGAVEARGFFSRDHDNAFGRMMDQNETRVYNTFDDGSRVLVYDVHHQTRVEIRDNGSYTEGSQRLRFRAQIEAANGDAPIALTFADGQYIAVKEHYSDNHAMAQTAMQWVMDEHVRQKIIERFSK